MFTSDKEIILTVITSALLMIFLIVIVVIAIVRYQLRLRQYNQEISAMKINFQEEILKIQSEIEEKTFQRISEEIHDNIGQILSLAKVSLHTLRLEPSHPAHQQISSINDYVGKAINDLRQLSKSLNSAQLSHQSLFECIRLEIEHIRKTGIYTTSIEEHNDEQPIDANIKMVIFRIIQEVLNNILKHARAINIFALVDYDPEYIKIKISDDGIGFDTQELENASFAEKGSGLGNIYRRSKLLNAEVKFDSRPGKGTIFELKVPIN